MTNIQEVGEQKLCEQFKKKSFVSMNKYCVLRMQVYGMLS